MVPQLSLPIRAEVVPATVAHAFKLATNLRKADADEVRAASGHRPLRALVDGIKASKEPWTVMVGSEPVAIFGVVPFGEYGAVWMLGSDRIMDIRRTFIRESRYWLDFISRDFQVVGNLIDARNTLHIRWLKWLGFDFIGVHPEHGHEKRPFLEFVKVLYV